MSISWDWISIFSTNHVDIVELDIDLFHKSCQYRGIGYRSFLQTCRYHGIRYRTFPQNIAPTEVGEIWRFRPLLEKFDHQDIIGEIWRFRPPKDIIGEIGDLEHRKTLLLKFDDLEHQKTILVKIWRK
ncbi:hypothetical protein RCL_jg8910.t1 [Rhizophagus clarus]|uniref:Uncharacterized protein n=1 Tax=Rhizophagus clarus TaxID=94130 RepID=A0A8H3KXV9_9GLOM|nr:hypothetical protein RCL_jg8910.t1 [Rhizophagus clarus]